MLRSYLMIISFIFLSGEFVFCQVPPIAEYRMDDCVFGDSRSGYDALFFGGNACACGVRANGVEFDGNINFVEFPDEISTLFEGDFSMTFYVQFDPQDTEPIDLFYYGANCGSDSLFSVRYLPNINQLRVRLSDAPTNEVQIQGDLSSATCWQYIAITKVRSIINLYVNGQLMDQGSATSDVSINLFTKENLTISNSPCQRVAINPDLPFKGKIDELRFYNYALSEREVVESDYYPDQIITRDTTIFIGESIQLMTGGTCAGLFSWSPSEGLSDTNVLSPIATPVQSTVYTFTTDDGTCAVTDQVRVSVFSREEITCDDLLLPSAFTPNEDRINDFYNISNIFLIQELKSFEIFNKWGGRVFYTEQLNSAWDGKFNSEAVQPGAYVYKVSYICQDQSFVKSGVVNVIR